MQYSCELIMNENNKLKISDLDKSALNIFEYLNIHHGVNAIKIDVYKEDKKENIFSFFDEEADYLKISLDFYESINTIIRFTFLLID